MKNFSVFSESISVSKHGLPWSWPFWPLAVSCPGTFCISGQPRTRREFIAPNSPAPLSFHPSPSPANKLAAFCSGLADQEPSGENGSSSTAFLQILFDFCSSLEPADSCFMCFVHTS